MLSRTLPEGVALLRRIDADQPHAMLYASCAMSVASEPKVHCRFRALSASDGLGTLSVDGKGAVARALPLKRSLRSSTMTNAFDYTPPAVWEWKKSSDGHFAHINRPIAGATHAKELPVGKHPLQLYSLGTPNGVKVTVMLEELLALGESGAEYDAWLIRIWNGEQFGSGFVDLNPNSKIPALVDLSGALPVRVFESGAILLHLAQKFDRFLPTEIGAKAECLSWLFWQMGSAPYLGGGFGHFYSYAPVKLAYAIDRFAMEVKRQLDVLNRRLEETRFLAGDAYSIADIACWPWYGALALGQLYDAGEFLQVEAYANVRRWALEIAERPAVRRGRMVNRTQGELSDQLHERHDASDFETRTQDKLSRPVLTDDASQPAR